MTPKAKAELLKMQTQAKFPFLIKIVHEDLGTFRYANCDETITYDSEEYLPALFSIDRGARQEGSISNAQLTLSAVDQEWIVKIRSTQKRAKLYFVASIVNGNEVEPMAEEEYGLKIVNWDELSISWEMIFDETMDILIPSDVATSTKNPAVWC